MHSAVISLIYTVKFKGWNFRHVITVIILWKKSSFIFYFLSAKDAELFCIVIQVHSFSYALQIVILVLKFL